MQLRCSKFLYVTIIQTWYFKQKKSCIYYLLVLFDVRKKSNMSCLILPPIVVQAHCKLGLTATLVREDDKIQVRTRSQPACDVYYFLSRGKGEKKIVFVRTQAHFFPHPVQTPSELVNHLQTGTILGDQAPFTVQVHLPGLAGPAVFVRVQQQNGMTTVNF